MTSRFENTSGAFSVTAWRCSPYAMQTALLFNMRRARSRSPFSLV
jgi:hypothetical protein